MDTKTLISQKLAKTIRDTYELDVKPELSIPPQKQFGDFSTNVGFAIAKELKVAPMEVANKLKDNLDLDFVTEIRIVSPGFINFFINQNAYAIDVVKKLIKPIKYNLDLTFIDKKIIVEHTSVNPNKAMHIGHLRNTILGDAVVRLLKKQGYQVEVQNYIDDLGLQVADTINAYLNLDIKYDHNNKSFDDYCWDIYSQINKLYLTDQDLVQKRQEILHKLESHDQQITKIADEIVSKILACQLSELHDLGVVYDLLVYESDIMKSNLWEYGFAKLKETSNFVYETDGKNDGCWVLKNDGDGGDKVLVRSNGTKVYTAKDVVYHLWKFNLIDFDFNYAKIDFPNLNYDLYRTLTDSVSASKKFGRGDVVINIIDERQTYPQEMVKLSLSLLGYKDQVKNYHHIAYGVVGLSRSTAQKLGVDVSDQKQTYAMSGRKGIGVKSKDLIALVEQTIKSQKVGDREYDAAKIKQIANSAVKFYMLKNNPLSAITFDYKEATNLNGATGPYIQYTYARAQSILNKMADAKPDLEVIKDHNINQYEYDLVKQIDEWIDLVASVSRTFAVSQIAEYSLKLCAIFNTFYHANPVVNADKITSAFRYYLICAFLNVLKESMDIMGIEVVRDM